MADLKFLGQEDLIYIEGRLKQKLETNSVTLERGYSLDTGSESFCYLIVRDGRRKRYKIDATCELFTQNGGQMWYPSKIWVVYEYDKNFAFNDRRERDFFNQLANEYINGKIDADQAFQTARLASFSKQELVDDVKKNYSKITGIGAGVLGFISAAAIYKISEYTPIEMKNHVDFWTFSLALGWLTGFIRSSIPAFNMDLDVQRRKKQMIRELTDIVKSEQSKTA